MVNTYTYIPKPVRELWIIEAPGKAKTLQSCLQRLGLDARVFATKGHLLGFPDKLNPVGIDADLKEVERKVKDPDHIKRMRAEAAVATRVVIATDADQEGDVIAWDVADILSDIHSEPLRVKLKSMDDESILQAADESTPVRMEDAIPGRARAIMDRLIGATYSRDGVAVGRVGTAILGLFKPGSTDEALTTKRLRLCVSSSDNGKPWIADTAVLPPLDDEIAERLRELVFPKMAPSGENSQYTASPNHTGDILSRAADIMNLSPTEAMKSMQRSYEAGRMSYPRSGSRSISDAANNRISEILKKANQRFDAEIVVKKVSSDVHDAPHPVGPLVNLTMNPNKIDVDEGLRVLITGDLVRTGQIQTIETPNTTPIGPFLKGRGFPSVIIEQILGLKWKREKGPRYPGQESWQQSETYERHPAAVLLESIVKAGLGRASTWASHVDGFLGRGLVDSNLQLTAKGNKWMEVSPLPLLDPRMSALMEKACENMSWAKPIGNEKPWEALARNILSRTPINGEVMATAAATPLLPRQDPWAGLRLPVEPVHGFDMEDTMDIENPNPIPPNHMFSGEN